MKNKKTVAIIGAGGKMGNRITNNLIKTDYKLLFCEKGSAVKNLEENGLKNTETAEAVPGSDIVIMAVPDILIGSISQEIVPLMKSNTILILLDPAAAYAETVLLRDDCTYIVAHPCHPALYKEQDSLEAYSDFFGGVSAKQDIVTALYHGDEDNYALAEDVSRMMYAPVDKVFRITIEQMIILEPAAVEVAGGAVTYFIRDLINEVSRRGIPEEAARSFILGHLRTVLAIIINVIPSKVSDSCQIAIENNYDKIFKEDWKEIFNEDSMKETVKQMLKLN